MDLIRKNIETLLDDYMFGFEYQNITISDFFDNFVNKPKWLTKNQLSRYMVSYCKKRGYDLIKKSNGTSRYYSFKPCKIIVDREYLIDMRLNERIVIPNDEITGIDNLLKNAHNFSRSKFLFEPCSELYHSLHRIA